ncbi:MAG: hypothetical protein QM704_25450 [Anaeromyxobacteraceae bacterium]
MYRRDTDERHGGRGPPLHDIHSHAADSIRYAALCLADHDMSPVYRDPSTGRTWAEPRVLSVRSSLHPRSTL